MSGKKHEDKPCTEDLCPPTRNVTHPLRYYEFTNEELKALEECDQESFYQRCVPLSTLFATATYAAVKYGVLKRNPHFGAVPKVLTAILLGHIFGRMSYLSSCELKLRELPPNSHLGKVMRNYYQERYPPPPKK
ncbi:OCIA domain-containing protein 1-like [Leptidea sinapis]|uniref:OCIA domain-containing protein n=1 Tax=Leptidea sinapis TaxID=189913 RepID=A0A5E4PM01_9NEOP|nr:OCIA domain-containing protein 1-like [Leptidea sinapis]VVC86316.1 unnamed protein product [Leptidea sinapis]